MPSRPLAPADYPPRLRDLAAPPPVLHLSGALTVAPTVALVGTRTPSVEGERWARALARDLVAQGLVVASGGAIGIDAAVHEGALDGGGATVVVAPGGLLAPYPECHRDLFQRVVEQGGAYLSLQAAETPARRSDFFLRNSILVALSHAVIVIECPVRSGARNAAKWARVLGRPLFAVPHSPWFWQGRGCVDEVALGARVYRGIPDLLTALATSGQRPIARRPRRSVPVPVQLELPCAEASPAERVLGALMSGPLDRDSLALATGLTPALLGTELTRLTIEGRVRGRPGGSVFELTH